MYLKTLEINNFRPFYGKNIFEFNKETVIFGKNGSGKSSLINAIYWCLYGKELSDFHSQPLCNYNIINEVEVGEEIHVRVVCKFSDENKLYSIERDSVFIKINNSNEFKIVSADIFEIFLINEDNKISIVHPIIFIDKHFPEFLFLLLCCSEEHIDSFFNREVFTNLKRIINEFALSYLIDKTNSHLSKLSKYYIKNKLKEGNELDFLLFKQNNIETELEEVKQKIDLTTKDLINVNKEKSTVENELRECLNNYDGNDIFMQKQTLIKEADFLSNRILDLKKKQSKLIINVFPFVVGLSDIPESFNSEKLKAFFQENINFKNSEFYSSIYNLVNPSQSIIKIKNLTRDISKYQEELSIKSRELMMINEIISHIGDEQVSKLTSILKKIEITSRSLDEKLSYLNKIKKSLVKDLNYNKKMLTKYRNQNSSFNNSKINFCTDAIEFGNLVKQKLNEDLLKEFKIYINGIFINHFKMNYKYKEVVVNESYDISLITPLNQMISINDLPKSEKNLLKISITLTVFKCLNLDYPIILMDTFNNLDDEKRELLIPFILKNPFNNQFILILNKDQYENNIKLSSKVVDYGLEDIKGYTEVKYYGCQNS